MHIRRLSTELALYIIVFILASFFRFYNLGAASLSDFEASRANQALPDAQSFSSYGDTGYGSQPAYVILTGAGFRLFGSSNFMARFWPALTGALLIFLPFFFKRELGQKAALILAFGLAIDPGLVAISRLAGSSMMATSFTLLSLGWIWAGSPVLCGVFLGMGLLSGSSSLLGITSLGILWLISKRIRLPFHARLSQSDFKLLIRPTLVSAGLTLLIAGTFFSSYPSGLADWASMIAEYFSGWMTPSGNPATRMIIALLVYQPLAVLLLLTHVFYWLVRQSLSDEVIKPPSIWSLLWLAINLIIVLLYPGRYTADLTWILIPLWVFAAQGLGQLLPDKKLHVISTILAGLIFILLALFWNTILSTRQVVSFSMLALPEDTARLVVQIILFLGVIGLGGLSTLMVSLGWSPRVGRDGLVIGLTIGFIMYSISVMWGASQLRHNRPEELWAPPPATGRTDLFLDTLNSLSEQNSGFNEMIDILSTVDAPSMRWILRDFEKAEFSPEIPIGKMPSIVVTPQEQASPSLTAAYRGQDFVWWVDPGWASAAPLNFVEWLLSRQAPVIEKQIILWARSDLFPGGELESTNE